MEKQTFNSISAKYNEFQIFVVMDTKLEETQLCVYCQQVGVFTCVCGNMVCDECVDYLDYVDKKRNLIFCSRSCLVDFFG